MSRVRSTGPTFFGSFLLARRTITATQLQDAITYTHRHKRSIGQLAVERGLITPAIAEALHEEQRQVDRLFGELAVERGVLTASQIHSLLEEQRSDHVRIGTALVRIGALSETERDGLLAEYLLCDQPVEPPVSLCPEADYALGLVQRVLTRFAQTPSRVWRTDHSPEQAWTVSMHIEVGDDSGGVRFGLESDDAQARHLVAGVLGFPVDEVDAELLADGFGELVNVVGGNLKTELFPAGNTGFPVDGVLPDAPGFTLMTPHGSGRVRFIRA